MSSEQIRIVARILADLGQISTASVVVPFLIPTFASEAITTIISGILMALVFWSLSVLSVKGLQ